jgi:tRNA pseudouridine38-40 synthase
MRKILLTIEYFGKNFAGWQCQDNAISVQQVLEEKLSLVLQENIKVYASGRTDKGVHALGQKAHFLYSGNIEDRNIARAVNATLPYDIRIVEAKEIFDKDFHAQYSAKKKTYLYKFYISSIVSPLRYDTYAQIPCDIDKLDYEKMEKAVKDLIGEHDFIGFSATGNGIKKTIRTMYEAKLEKKGDEIYFTITGNGFLYNMVRIIAGTLVWIGLGRLPEDAIEQTLITKSRLSAGKTFPAQGLTLVKVEY